MDLVKAFTNLQHANVMSQVQFKVARKMLDVQQAQGQAAVKLIAAATQNASAAGDALVAAATGLGGELDTLA